MTDPVIDRDGSRNRITHRQREMIAKALREKGAIIPCPRCQNKEMSVLDGLFAHVVQSNLSNLTLGGDTVPIAVCVCTRCGYLAEHALGVLGLLNNPEFMKAGESE